MKQAAPQHANTVRHVFFAHDKTIDDLVVMGSEHEITDGHSGASTVGARARAAQWTEADIIGLKYFDPLLSLLERLKDDGSARDRAGNIEQHCDQYCLLVLLYLFNPIC